MHDNEYSIFKLVEGDLDSKEKLELLNHIDNCPECREILSRYNSIKGTDKTYYGSLILPEDAQNDLTRLNTELKKRKNISLAYFSAAAAVIIGFILVLSLSLNKVKQYNQNVEVKNVLVQNTTNNTLSPEPDKWDMSVYSLNRQINIIMDNIAENPL